MSAHGSVNTDATRYVKPRVEPREDRTSMAVNSKDTERQTNPARPAGKPFRLLGIDGEGKPYFYWSATPGEYAAYYGGKKPDKWVWGTLSCGSGKRMKPENRVFIADLPMVRALEQAGVFRPCYTCNKQEYQRWTKEQQSA